MITEEANPRHGFLAETEESQNTPNGTCDMYQILGTYVVWVLDKIGLMCESLHTE